MAFDPGKWPLLWWQKLARRGGCRLQFSDMRKRHTCRYSFGTLISAYYGISCLTLAFKVLRIRATADVLLEHQTTPNEKLATNSMNQTIKKISLTIVVAA